MIGGALAAATGGDIGQGFLTGAITGAIFGGIGFGVGQLGIKGIGVTIAHALGGAASGAINASITGGDIGMSALISGISAGASQWIGANVSFLQDRAVKGIGDLIGNTAKHAAIGALVGGGISAAFGGDFVEGAVEGAKTAAIAYNANFLESAVTILLFDFVILGAAAILLTSPQMQESIRNLQINLQVLFAKGKSTDKPSNLPPGAVENPNRKGSWGEYDENGKFKERWRLDEGKKGKTKWGGKDHVHVDGQKEHLPPDTPYPL